MKLKHLFLLRVIAALTFAGISNSTVAGLHHWAEWKTGVIESIDPVSHTLTLSSSSRETSVVQWNERTRQWARGLKANDPGQPVNPDALKKGERIQVLLERKTSSLVAQRILLDPPAR